MKSNMFKSVALSSMIVLLSSCGDKDQSTATTAAPQAQPDTNVAAQQQPAQQNTGVQQTAADPGHSGRVIETMEGGGYTYINVENNSGKFWLASSRAELKVGQTIYWRDYQEMKDFHSKALNRTFPSILFVSAVSLTEIAAAPASTPSATAAQGKALSVTASGGYSYIEVDTGKETVWIAAPETAVANGAKVSWNGGTPMANFYSKTLKKNFPSIYFVSAVSVIQ